MSFDLTKYDLITRLEDEDSLFPSFKKVCEEARDFLNRVSANFPTYTDHSITHSFTVIQRIEMLLNEEDIENLNNDEIYILLVSAILHDIGMGIPVDDINEEIGSEKCQLLKHQYETEEIDVDFIRKFHHELSYYFIMNNYEILGIINEDYAEVIALIAKAHRKVKIDDFNIYEIRKILRDGTDFVCMPYLACLLRLGDELDITNRRTPEIILKYYSPDDDEGIREFRKHIATNIVNRQDKLIIIKATTDSREVYNALDQMIKKIQKVLTNCQKIVNTLGIFDNKEYKLEPSKIEPDIKTKGFKPKNIGFSFNIDFIFKNFIDERLYQEEKVAIREIMQNAIDACRMRALTAQDDYSPEINIEINDKFMIFKDNGVGMDLYEVETFFSQIGTSFFYKNKELPQFKSIGRFGMGILSYFMICDTFEIQTKKRDTEILRFRVDKKQDLNFLFFDSNFDDELEQGTIIKIPINYQNPEIFGYYNLKDIIEHFFINLNIQIRLNSRSKKTETGVASILKFEPQFQKVDLDLIMERIPFSFKEKKPKLVNIEQKEIDEDDVEGKLYLFYSLDKDSRFKSLSRYANEMGVRIFQNNIYIQQVESKNLYTLGGYLNFKKNKFDLNLNKTSVFSQFKLQHIIQEYEIQLLNQFIDKFLISNDLNDKRKISNDFYTKIFKSRSFYYDSRSDKYYNFFKDTLFPKTLINHQLELIQFGDFIKNNEKFLLAPIEDTMDPNNYKELDELVQISREFGLELLIPSYQTLLLYLEWIYNNKYTFEVLGGPLFAYLIIDTSNTVDDYKKLFNKYLFLNFKNKSNPIFAKIMGSYPVSVFQCLLNSNHPLINFIINNEEEINQSIKIVVNNLFETCIQKKSTDLISFPEDLKREYEYVVNQINTTYRKSFSNQLSGL